MKIESRKCINISKIVEYLSELTLRQSFLKFIQLQGLTQLPFYMVLGKLKFLKMSKWKRKTQASKGNRCLYWKVYSNCLLHRKRRRQSNWNKGPMHKQTNIKTSQSFSPGEKLMLQAIESIHYEVYYCSTVDEAIVSDILLQDVWIVDNKNEEARLEVPLWFTGMFLISCFHFYSNQQI